MGKSFHDQLIAFELGNSEWVEVAPEQSHRVSAEGRAVATSAPMELVALLFPHEAQNQEEQLLRQALTLSVERTAIRSVLLQGAGQISGSILPTWMSGYGFVFPTEADLPRARHLTEQVRKVPTWTLGYDAGDPLSKLVAERIALNARVGGLTLQPTTASSTDVRLVRIPLASVTSRISLVNAAAACGFPPPKLNAGSAEDLYSAERAMLATWRLIPLFHLPLNYAIVPSLKSWSIRADGGWELADAWLGSDKR
jgi:hypothetical protein